VPTFPQVGVEAIVKGYSTFMKQTQDMDRQLQKLGRGTQDAGRKAQASGGAFGALGGFLGRVGTIAGGILAADIFRKLAGGIADIAGESWNTAVALQSLGVRFETLVAREKLGANSVEEFIDRLDALDKTSTEGALSIYQENRIKALRIEWERITDILATAAEEGKDQLPYYQGLGDYLGIIEEQMAKAIPMWEDLSPEMQAAAFGTLEMTDALKAAKQPAKDLLDWAVNFSLTTPFETKTISNVVAMGMAYGFSAEEMKELTGNIGDFTAGMGLGDEHMQRIIQNFGQMQSAGKVTGTELRDLARGAFLPVNDILARMQENLGLGGTSFDSFKKQAAKGVFPVEEFFVAFNDVVGEQFAGSMERMAGTWEGATTRFKNFLTTVLGAEMLGPVLDNLTENLNTMMETLLTPENREAAQMVGEALGGLVTALGDLLGFDTADFPSIAEILGGIEDAIRGTTGFVQAIADNINNFQAGDIDLMGFAINISTLLVEAFRNAFVGFADLVLEIFGFEMTWLEVIEVWKGVINTFPAALAGVLVEASEGATALLEGIGGAIIAGLQTGMERAWQGLVSWYEGIIADMPDLMKKLLGIGSPSKIFAELGASVMQGIQVGMISEQKAPARALEIASGNMAQAVASPLATPSQVDQSRNLNMGDANINTPLDFKTFDSMMREWLGS
jgi:tape measure domain-containing protein